MPTSEQGPHLRAGPSPPSEALTSEQGLFHEALNMAAIWRLPVLFVCENNQVPLAITPLPAASHPSALRLREQLGGGLQP